MSDTFSSFADVNAALNTHVQQITDSVPNVSHNLTKNKFGCLVEEKVYKDEPLIEKTITAPLLPYHLDYAQQEAFLGHALDHHNFKSARIANGEAPIATCDTRAPEESPTDFGMLLPVFSAEVSESNPKMTYEGRCFQEITFEYEKVSETAFNVNVTTANPRSKMCKDVILFANTEIQHFEIFYFHGKHRLTFQMNTPEAQADVGYGGIKAFAFCENVIQDIESLW